MKPNEKLTPAQAAEFVSESSNEFVSESNWPLGPTDDLPRDIDDDSP